MVNGVCALVIAERLLCAMRTPHLFERCRSIIPRDLRAETVDDRFCLRGRTEHVVSRTGAIAST